MRNPGLGGSLTADPGVCVGGMLVLETQLSCPPSLPPPRVPAPSLAPGAGADAVGETPEHRAAAEAAGWLSRKHWGQR